MTERVTELEVLITSNVEEGDFSMIEKSGGYTELAVFYAVAQTLFLVFCFRWRDLLEDGEDPDEEHFDGERSRRRWLRPLDIVQRLITSPLNPLKVSTLSFKPFQKLAKSILIAFLGLRAQCRAPVCSGFAKGWVCLLSIYHRGEYPRREIVCAFQQFTNHAWEHDASHPERVTDSMDEPYHLGCNEGSAGLLPLRSISASGEQEVV